jgi:hypothetical protein
MSEIIELDLTHEERQQLVVLYLRKMVDSSSIEILDEYVNNGDLDAGIINCIFNAAVVDALQRFTSSRERK